MFGVILIVSAVALILILARERSLDSARGER